MIEVTESTFNQMTKTSKTFLLQFSASWCGPCHAMRPRMHELEQKTGVQVFIVDVDRCPSITNRYNIKSVPTFVMVKEGTEVARKTGVHPVSSLQALVS